jgi:WD40 repeat protein
MVNEQSSESFKYWAFISYSHHDKAWGDWLHKALETYRVPARLVGQSARDGKVPARLFPVFRDREELPTSADLAANIRDALRASRHLIVICSPRSGVSRWVNEEVKAFKAMGRENRILCLIVDGEPNASDTPNSGLLECFPEALRYRVDSSGRLTSERTEPIAADVRKGKDGKENAKLKLLAGVLGISFDDLKQRERQRLRRQRVQLAAGAAAAVVAMAGGFGWVSHQRSTAELHERLVNLGRQELLAARPAQALAYLGNALKLDPKDGTSRFLAAQALPVLDAQVFALRTIGPAYKQEIRLGANEDSGFRVRYKSPSLAEPVVEVVRSDGTVRSFEPGGLIRASSPNVQYVLTEDLDHVASVWDVSSGKPMILGPAAKVAGFIENARFSGDGKRVALWRKQSPEIELWDPASGRLVASIKADSDPFRFTSDGSRLVSTQWKAGAVNVFDAATGRLVFTVPACDLQQLTADGDFAACKHADGTAKLWNLATGRELGSIPYSASGDEALWLVTGLQVNSGATHAVASIAGRKGPGAALRRLWRIADGSTLASFQSYAAQFSPDGRLLAVQEPEELAIYDVQTGSRRRLDAARYKHLDFSGGGNFFLAATGNSSVKIWDTRDWTVANLLPEDGERSALRIYFAARPGHLVYELADGVKIVDLQAAAAPISLKPQNLHVRDGSFSGDGSRVVLWSDNGAAIAIHDAVTGRLVRRIDEKLTNYSFDRYVITRDPGLGVMKAWNLSTGEPVVLGPKDRLSVRGGLVATIGGNAVEIFDVDRQAVVSKLIGHTDPITSATFSKDGSRVTTLSKTQWRAWETRTGKELLSIDVARVNGGPDDRCFTVLSDKRATVWDSATLSAKRAFDESGKVVYARTNTDCSKLFTFTGEWGSSSKRASKIWDVASGRVVISAEGLSSSFNADGSRVFGQPDEGSLELWDSREGRKLATIKGGHEVFDPTGKAFLTLNGDVLDLWRSEDGSRLQSLRPHSRPIKWAEFTSRPDGSFVTVDDMGEGKLWRSDDSPGIIGAVVQTNAAPDANGYVPIPVLSPDGSRVLAFDKNGSATLWLNRLEKRSSEQIAALVAERVSWHLEGEILTAASARSINDVSRERFQERSLWLLGWGVLAVLFAALAWSVYRFSSQLNARATTSSALRCIGLPVALQVAIAGVAVAAAAYPAPVRLNDVGHLLLFAGLLVAVVYEVIYSVVVARRKRS